MERRAGIEPASPAWKAGVLPLHKRRNKKMLGEEPKSGYSKHNIEIKALSFFYPVS